MLLLTCLEPGCEEHNPDNFYKRHTRSNEYYPRYKKHHNKQRSRLNREVKDKIIKYLGGKCIQCGYNKCKRALELHHTLPESKDPNYYSLRNHTFLRIKKELDKCVLLCSNCHRETHEEMHLDDNLGY